MRPPRVRSGFHLALVVLDIGDWLRKSETSTPIEFAEKRTPGPEHEIDGKEENATTRRSEKAAALDRSTTLHHASSYRRDEKRDTPRGVRETFSTNHWRRRKGLTPRDRSNVHQKGKASTFAVQNGALRSQAASSAANFGPPSGVARAVRCRSYPLAATCPKRLCKTGACCVPKPSNCAQRGTRQQDDPVRSGKNGQWKAAGLPMIRLCFFAPNRDRQKILPRRPLH